MCVMNCCQPLKNWVNDNFRPPTRAFDLAVEAKSIIPGDFSTE
jgi:hypothetical protein